MNFKPRPLFAEPERPKCPHCGMTSYSPSGIHPQCSHRAADEDWTKQMRARHSSLETVPDKAPKMFQRQCPKCQTALHVRAKRCSCGFVFPIKTRSSTEE